ncbi:MAG: phosphogluconate dehydratase [Pseudomonadota bacterium]
MTNINPVVRSVTDRILQRSEQSRAQYLARVQRSRKNQPRRNRLSCTNFAHAVAAASPNEKLVLHQERTPTIGIVSSYNEMLSAHQPFNRFPVIIKNTAIKNAATALFAGGVPAMCDGVTQGQPGMELSLFSRDIIAQATAIALSHDTFDAVVCLGTCDKIVPGLVMGALEFGHLPMMFAPAGPMTSGLPNSEKAQARQQFALGKIDRKQLLETECQSYHGPGTCTFYGTANSNQMLMEVMGLHLPGSAFINPGHDRRDALTEAAAERVLQLTALHDDYLPLADIITPQAICNAITGLLATGGSTNHTIHLIAMARCAGIVIDWTDFNDLSNVVPTLTRIYPNGKADVNQFHAAGGMATVIGQLLSGGLLHNDVKTVAGDGLERYCQQPFANASAIHWKPVSRESEDDSIIASVDKPFDKTGGITLLTGNLGRAVIKASAVAPEHRVVEAPAKVFTSQAEFLDAFNDDQLNADFVAVLKNQGPQANGMPELHKLTPALGVLQDAGYHVALVTDGRMSGASGKVPAAIHVSPECIDGGPLSKVQNGDPIKIDATKGILEALVDDNTWQARTTDTSIDRETEDCGRHLFERMRSVVSSAETGAISLFNPDLI